MSCSFKGLRITTENIFIHLVINTYFKCKNMKWKSKKTIIKVRFLLAKEVYCLLKTLILPQDAVLKPCSLIRIHFHILYQFLLQLKSSQMTFILHLWLTQRLYFSSIIQMQVHFSGKHILEINDLVGNYLLNGRKAIECTKLVLSIENIFHRLLGWIIWSGRHVSRASEGNRIECVLRSFWLNRL